MIVGISDGLSDGLADEVGAMDRVLLGCNETDGCKEGPVETDRETEGINDGC